MARRSPSASAQLGLGLALCASAACASSAAKRAAPAPAAASRSNAGAAHFLAGLVRPWPDKSSALALAVSSETGEHVASYDNALLALYFLRTQERETAGRLLAGLAALQRDDGAIPFSFAWPSPDAKTPYTRSGASAWVGYAAVEYLDSDRGGPAREAITRMAHRIARYLLDHQVHATNDPRDGLVLGGEGSFRLESEGDRVREVYAGGDVAWASTEHNIDAYFFLRDFAVLTGNVDFATAAEQIRAALVARGFRADAGQFVEGFQADALDLAYALDCASWGSLFLLAAGERIRAETALASAEFRYAARDSVRGVRGHRPYAHARVVNNPRLIAELGTKLGDNQWDSLDAVWPEGSAGVALAELRLGHPRRARELLDELERLRAPSGGLPTFTLEIPFELDALPSVAGTAWVELVRYELALDQGRESFWRSH